jgi:hypothetical protein
MGTSSVTEVEAARSLRYLSQLAGVDGVRQVALFVKAASE